MSGKESLWLRLRERWRKRRARARNAQLLAAGRRLPDDAEPDLCLVEPGQLAVANEQLAVDEQVP
jgi:hypothetical protein